MGGRMDDLVTVERPIEEVFAFVADQANNRLWKPFVSQSERVYPGPLGVGSQFVEGIDVFNRHLTGIVEVLEYQPPHRYVYRTRDEPYPFSLTARLSFKASGSGTLIQGQASLLGHGRVWHWFTPLVRLFIKSQERRSFQRLKRVMENLK